MNKFDRLMTHDVVPVEVSRSASGDETETELNTEKGFFEYRKKRLFNTEGEVIDGQALLFLKNDSQYDPTKSVEWKFKDVKNDNVLRLEMWDVVDDPRTGETHHYELDLI